MPYFFQGEKISHRGTWNDARIRHSWARFGLKLRLRNNRADNPKVRLFEKKRTFLGHFPTGEVRGWLKTKEGAD